MDPHALFCADSGAPILKTPKRGGVNLTRRPPWKTVSDLPSARCFLLPPNAISLGWPPLETAFGNGFQKAILGRFCSSVCSAPPPPPSALPGLLYCNRSLSGRLLGVSGRVSAGVSGKCPQHPLRSSLQSVQTVSGERSRLTLLLGQVKAPFIRVALALTTVLSEPAGSGPIPKNQI